MSIITGILTGKRLYSFLLASLGYLLVTVPHFALPLGYLTGRDAAQIPLICSVWYHPETYLGPAMVVAGILSYKYKTAFFGCMALAVLVIVQSFALQPVGFYAGNRDSALVLSQLTSIKGHAGIGYTLFAFGSMALLFSILAIGTINGDSAQKSLAQKNLETMSLFSVVVSGVLGRAFRSLSLAVMVSLVSSAVFTYAILEMSVEKTLLAAYAKIEADMVAVPRGKEAEAEEVLKNGTPKLFYMNGDVPGKILKIRGVQKVSPHLFLKPFSYNVEDYTENVLVVGYSADSDFTVWPWIKYSLKADIAGDELAVGNMVKYYPGQKVWFAGKKLRVVATLSQTGIGYIDRVAFMPIEGARRLLNELKNSDSGKVNKRPTANRQSAMDFGHLISREATDSPVPKDLNPDGVSMVFIKVSDSTLSKALASSIASNVDGISVILLNKNAAMVKSAISQAMRPLLIPTVALVLMASMVVGVVFSMMVRERTRELGLLRAMGARRRDVFMVVALESLLVSIAGSFAGLVAGGSLLLVFKNNVMAALEIESLWPGSTVVIAVSMGAMFVSIIVGVSGALYPAYRACLMDPSNALGYSG